MQKPFSELFRNTPGRLLLFYPIFAAVFLFLAGGLAWRQIVQREKLEQQAMQQSMRRILQPGTRGNIYDRNGKLLVGNRPVFNAVMFLGELRAEFREEYVTRAKALKNAGKPIDRTALRRQSRAAVLQRYLNEINRIIGKQLRVDPHELDRHFSQQMLLPYPLVKDLEPRDYARLIEHLPMNSPIQIYTQSARYYPYGRAAAHVLG
ncbi:MAG TPA: peptidoglycan glycosyltransferase, partial [Opitutales bacterium]|nr:peptidoglycan glycosyltransferase [Opitutales bacterium]